VDEIQGTFEKFVDWR